MEPVIFKSFAPTCDVCMAMSFATPCLTKRFMHHLLGIGIIIGLWLSQYLYSFIVAPYWFVRCWVFWSNILQFITVLTSNKGKKTMLKSFFYLIRYCKFNSLKRLVIRYLKFCVSQNTLKIKLNAPLKHDNKMPIIGTYAYSTVNQNIIKNNAQFSFPHI